MLAARAIGEEPKLRLLDAVLHLAASAVELLVELPAVAFEVSDDEARIVAFGRVLKARDHAPLALPRIGAVAKLLELALVLLGLGKACFASSMLLGRRYETRSCSPQNTYSGK